ncbi:MAG: (5-formylfuran-3-yl)methyl phosphate synthase, partial [Planctomycetaceae bacterium]
MHRAPGIRDSAPKLLVSVRNVDEAREAIAGGCDILDVKEPANGSLGMADVRAIRDVCHIARTVSCPTSAALGETRDWFGRDDIPDIPDELHYVKLGTAGLTKATDWARKWRDVRDRFEVAAGRRLNWIAVAYADRQQAA